MALVTVVEGDCLLHQHLPVWALPAPGVTGDGARVAASTWGPHLPLHLGWFGPPFVIMPNLPFPVVLPWPATDPPAIMVEATGSPPVSWCCTTIPSPHTLAFLQLFLVLVPSLWWTSSNISPTVWFTWELSPCCPEDLDLLLLAEHWCLVKHWQLVEWPILSLRIAATARAHCWASFASAIIS